MTNRQLFESEIKYSYHTHIKYLTRKNRQNEKEKKTAGDNFQRMETNQKLYETRQDGKHDFRISQPNYELNRTNI